MIGEANEVPPAADHPSGLPTQAVPECDPSESQNT